MGSQRVRGASRTCSEAQGSLMKRRDADAVAHVGRIWPRSSWPPTTYATCAAVSTRAPCSALGTGSGESETFCQGVGLGSKPSYGCGTQFMARYSL